MSRSLLVLVVAVALAAPCAARAHHSGRADTRVPAAAHLRPAEGARVAIIVPTPGTVFKADTVPLEFKMTKGKRGEHVHAYVNGELMGMFKSERGTLTGITPGKHVLELRVAAEDHRTELDATDRVEFIVE